jgi:shikimate dehydrogenase
MRTPYADVIGDPISHSKSPLIHRFWLEKLGMPGDYRAIRVNERGLGDYFRDKRQEPYWRGCSVTFPLKQAVAAEVGDPSHACAALHAVNCVIRTPLGSLVGLNTDLDGMAAAFEGHDLAGKTVCLIGAGGAARAAFCYFSRERVGQINILARNHAKARTLPDMLGQAAPTGTELFGPDRMSEALAGAHVLVNATPLGTAGGEPMPSELLAAVAASGAEAAMDMVYAPADTDFLTAARRGGSEAISGLVMLVGQAAPAFELFFGATPPREHDAELRALLAR